ncbi:MAG: acetate/propionate family kinase [Phycisphaeraceae bacterium]|nr:acetate/propionate family kinase [Phycisphaeraceae bacterium]
MTSAAAPTSFVIAINGGSSSIKVAVFGAGTNPVRMLRGSVDRIGSAGAEFRLEGSLDDATSPATEVRAIGSLAHKQAAEVLATALHEKLAGRAVLGIGHRIVYGGPGSPDHQLISPRLMDELRAVAKIDATHLPREIALIEVFQSTFAGVPQAMCLDTAFHRRLSRVATMLPIPRRFDEAGLRRYGYHGLSYEFLMSELEREEGRKAVGGRVVLAHLGSGASMAAVNAGVPIDTTMAASALSGLMMGTRPGDLDPGVVLYMAQHEKLAPDKLVALLNKECGLLGVSGISADVRDLLAKRGSDTRAAEAIDLFCWIARKHLGGMAASLGGIDMLVFAGGIGENSPEIRAGICETLGFLGIALDAGLNSVGKGRVSAPGSRVGVRVIPTDEEVMIARHVQRLVDAHSLMETR